jgi:predicted Fe-Mo cluster-binding NifX family protein
MKVAFPLMNSRELADDFSNSRFIGFYNESDQQVEIIPLENLKKVLGSDSFPEILISKELKAIVSQRFNIITLRILKEYGILALQARGNSLNNNIMDYNSGLLQSFNLYFSIFEEQCGSGCSSCNSSCT